MRSDTVPLPVPTPALPPASRALPRISLRRALAFPFSQSNWLSALVYIGAIQFVPVLGYLVIRGWRFDIARRVGANDAGLLPDWRQFGEHLKQGALLFAATQFYFLPLYLILWWPRSGVFWGTLRLVQWTYEWLFTNIDPGPFGDVLWPTLRSLLILLLVLVTVPPLLSGVVESATQRYAHTGRIWTLFQVGKNLSFAWNDLGDVVRIELCILGLSALVGLVSLILLLTVGGTIFIPPVMTPIYMWTRGALMGQWIWKNRCEEAYAAGTT